EKECDNVENSKVIALGMFKLSVSQSVSPISVTKTSCASNGVENLDTLSSVRRPKSNGVIWMRKGLSNNVIADLSFVNHSNLNKNVNRYSHKNLMACNNSDTRSAFDYNNARNALCNARMNASVDVNDLFVFDDVSIRKSHVSITLRGSLATTLSSICGRPSSKGARFRKKPHDSLNVRSKSDSNKSLPRTVHKWLPKLQPLAEPVAKWIPRVIYLDIFDSVRRPKNSGVIWKKKGSSNTSNVGLSAVNVSNLNKNVNQYSRKDLLACNNSHLGETRSVFICNDAMNVSCDSRMNDLLDDDNFFIFDDVNVRISSVSKMPFRKKPRDSMQVCSNSNMIKSLPETMYKWLPKLQPLAEPVAKWFPRIVQICLWIIDSGCSKHMTGNRALLMNFVKKFLGTVHFANNDFDVITGYGDVVIGSMTIKKFYYVE
nr:retrovirus-related Pol polyprotein from transposon TNT 1-94 [Tanacetum cinerariifolium]